MNRTLKLVAVLLCLGVSISYAQGPCTLQTFTGTYAFYEKGASTILDPLSMPYPLHWAGAIAPFVTMGEVTIGADGVGNGYFWIRAGSLNGGLDPIPVVLTITELNQDCTGKFQYDVNLLGTTTTIEERFILFDNGRQFRSVPTSTGISTVVWVGEGHRISKPGEPLNTCGPQTAYGAYLITAENFLPIPGVPNSPLFQNGFLMRLQVSMSGDFTGMLYEKLGPVGGIELPVWGTITVNPDCSFAESLNFEVHGVSHEVVSRGVYFNQGKNLYSLGLEDVGMGIQYSFGQGERIGH